ncbi:E3 ubiquitin-protein ligase TRIM45-like [Ruditapes philippinarum]|uniref:E3 ubiquitin-protein ligase TRIM45-like n=1 Tax=Ruditapes philippinarum TaxID=129788 RepID=UPI00295AC7DC|nr:E3 ubiquitin-protein ligase TRIM45-like [Ruditapes philippinarum]
MAVAEGMVSVDEKSENVGDIMCKPCIFDGNVTSAKCRCNECQENMCTECFQHHRRGKMCRNHTFLDTACIDGSSAVDEELGGLQDICPKHDQQPLTFYCATHRVIGCRDCIIFEHKTCKVSDISDKTMSLDNVDKNEYLDEAIKEIENCSIEIKEYEKEIKTNMDSTHATHKTFTSDAERFRKTIKEKMDYLIFDACEEANDTKTETLRCLEKLEVNASNMREELSAIKRTMEIEQNDPIRLFVTAIRSRKKMKDIKETFARFEKSNRARTFTFIRQETIGNVIEGCKGIDLIQRIPDAEHDKRNVSP